MHARVSHYNSHIFEDIALMILYDLVPWYVNLWLWLKQRYGSFRGDPELLRRYTKVAWYGSGLWNAWSKVCIRALHFEPRPYTCVYIFKDRYIYIYVNIHDSWYTYYAKPPYVLCKNKGSINHHENGLVTPDWVPPTWPWRDHSAVAALRRASRWRSVCVPVGARTSQMHPGCCAWNILVRLKNVP